MVQTCYICKWRADREPRRSFHKFPYEDIEKQKWLDIIGKSNVRLGKRTSVCNVHFDKSCFRYGLVNGREWLRPGSVPTILLERPPENYTVADMYFSSHNVIEVKIEPDCNDWSPAEPQSEHRDTKDVADSNTKETSKHSETNMIDVEVSASEKTLIPNIRLKRTREPVRRKDQKQSYLRMLVERLRREHVRLKNYIQTLEERQHSADRRRRKRTKPAKCD